MPRRKTRKMQDLSELKIGMTVRGLKSGLNYQITSITEAGIIATRLQLIANINEWKIVED